MRTRLGVLWLCALLACFAVALLLPPASIVDRFLPAKHLAYRDNIIKGFWLWKGVLLCDGILLLLLPYLKRLFPGRLTLRPSRPFRAPELAIVAVISLLAAVIRLYHITDGFSYDEYTINSALPKGPSFILMSTVMYRTFYSFLAKVAYEVIGPSEVAQRLPALISGIASVPAMHWLVRGSLGDRQGYLASLILAISTFHVWYSQSGTPYTLALFFTIISMAIYLKCARVDSLGPWLGWWMATVLLVFSHFFIACFVLAGQGIYAVWLISRREAEPWVLGRIAAVVVYAVAAFATCVAPAFFNALGLVKVQQAWSVPMSDTLATLARWLLQTYSPWPGQLLFALCVVLGLAIVWRNNRQIALYISLPTVALLGVFLGTVISTGALGAVGVRHCIFVLVPVCVFAGTTLSAALDALTGSRPGWRKVAAAVVLCIAALSIAVPAGSSLKAYFAKERRPFRATAEYVTRRVGPGEPVVYGGFGYGFGYDVFRHYLPNLAYAANYEEVAARLDHPQPFWLIHYQLAYLNRMPPAIRQRLEQRGSLELHYVGRQESPEDDWESFVWHVRGNPSP